MSYHPRIETADMASFLTTRSRNSELWFVNNTRLEQAILGYMAKFSARYCAKIYALAIEGNHIQSTADFPLLNRASFMRDFNSCVARAVNRYAPEYPGGGLWARRYSVEFMPAAEDLEDRFFYVALQTVHDGLVPRISDYPGYNCFHDAVWGITRKFKVVRWAQYNAAKRHNPRINIKDYTEIISFKYERLPGYENLSKKDYALMMSAKLEKRRQEIVEDRIKRGLGFVGREALLQIKPGQKPRFTKTSTTKSHRPRILSVCPLRRSEANSWYFGTYSQYRNASQHYRAGNLTVKFPPGTYPPPAVTRAISPPLI